MTTNIKNKYLYHYTSMDVLIILLNNYREKLSDGKNKDLIFWASSILTMNDPQEMNHGINVFKVLVPFNEDFYQVDPEERLDISTIDSKQVLHDYTHTPFVLSFSGNSDDFAMWKTYGGGGYGIALKFLNDVSSTPCFLNSAITPKNVYYGNGLDRFDSFVEIYNKGLDKLRKCVNEEERMICKKSTLSDIYYHLCPYIKTESYKNENESRISYNNVPVNYVKFRSRNKNIIPYIEAPIPSKYLKEVIIGPCCNMEINQSSISFLLNCCGLWDVEVTNSNIPYRDI